LDRSLTLPRFGFLLSCNENKHGTLCDACAVSIRNEALKARGLVCRALYAHEVDNYQFPPTYKMHVRLLRSCPVVQQILHDLVPPHDQPSCFASEWEALRAYEDALPGTADLPISLLHEFKVMMEEGAGDRIKQFHLKLLENAMITEPSLDWSIDDNATNEDKAEYEAIKKKRHEEWVSLCAMTRALIAPLKETAPDDEPVKPDFSDDDDDNDDADVLLFDLCTMQTLGSDASLVADYVSRDDFTGIDENRLLHRAASHGHIDVVKALLDAGADVNALSVSNESPIASAIRGAFDAKPHVLANCVPLLQLLVDRGADVSAPVNIDLLSLALNIPGSPGLASVQLLIDAGADFEALNDMGNTVYDLIEEDDNNGKELIELFARARAAAAALNSAKKPASKKCVRRLAGTPRDTTVSTDPPPSFIPGSPS
jgi:ankyrin repeat protein